MSTNTTILEEIRDALRALPANIGGLIEQRNVQQQAEASDKEEARKHAARTKTLAGAATEFGKMSPALGGFIGPIAGLLVESLRPFKQAKTSVPQAMPIPQWAQNLAGKPPPVMMQAAPSVHPMAAGMAQAAQLPAATQANTPPPSSASPTFLAYTPSVPKTTLAPASKTVLDKPTLPELPPIPKLKQPEPPVPAWMLSIPPQERAPSATPPLRNASVPTTPPPTSAGVPGIASSREEASGGIMGGAQGGEMSELIAVIKELIEAVRSQQGSGYGASGSGPQQHPAAMITPPVAQPVDLDADEGFAAASPSVNVRTTTGGIGGAGGTGFGSKRPKTQAARRTDFLEHGH